MSETKRIVWAKGQDGADAVMLLLGGGWELVREVAAGEGAYFILRKGAPVNDDEEHGGIPTSDDLAERERRR